MFIDIPFALKFWALLRGSLIRSCIINTLPHLKRHVPRPKLNCFGYMPFMLRTRLKLSHLIMICLGSCFILTASAATRLLPIENWQLQNGAKVFFVPVHSLPIIDIKVIFNAGSSRDGAHPGIAALTNDLLDQGTNNHSADQIADQLADVAASLDGKATRDNAFLQLRTLSYPQISQKAIQLLAEMINMPNFPQADFLREQKNTETELLGDQQEPLTIAINTFLKQLYGDHPYAHPVTGDQQSVQALTRQDIVNFYHQYYVGNNTSVVIIGDLTTANAHQMAQTLVEKLPAGIASPALPQPHALTGARTQFVDYPAKQSTNFIGQLGIAHNDKAYFPLLLANAILGGDDMTSLLFRDVRGNRGFVYSISSKIVPFDVAGPFFIMLQTRTEQTQAALDLTHQTVQKFYDNGPTPPQLAAAKQHIIDAFPLEFDSNADLLDKVSQVAAGHLPLVFFDTYRQNIERVRLYEVKNAFQQLVKMNKLLTVTVGSKADVATTRKTQ